MSQDIFIVSNNKLCSTRNTLHILITLISAIMVFTISTTSTERQISLHRGIDAWILPKRFYTKSCDAHDSVESVYKADYGPPLPPSELSIPLSVGKPAQIMQRF
ncbi:hypothetical protein RRG08_045968 [Elysia crispata]|uniref:Uncharacterized protein n=1 Tax=Elysia crispata TaxID=231223 RepID=A0AAE1ASA7_9GAST|nr:hypothetical protein RRG08_045968 [Elysia crispata]